MRSHEISMRSHEVTSLQPHLAAVEGLGLHVQAGAGVLLCLAVQRGQGEREQEAGQVQHAAPGQGHIEAVKR